MLLLMLLGVLAVAAGCVWFGYRWAVDDLRMDRMQVERERQALEIEWQALDRTRRMRSVLLHARRAMQDEARRPTYKRER